MRELITLFPKPSHYSGAEAGAIRKKPEDVNLRVALAFPDAYEVGMSYLGQKILYSIVNARPGWQAERVMAPSREAGEILLAHGAPLCTLESDAPLNKTAAVCFSITHELCYADVLRVLDLGQIPPRHKDRPEDLRACPLIVAGGGAMAGAEPLVPFIDIVALGDGEELFPELLELLEKARAENWPRSRYLLEAARIPGAYVPSLFSDDGTGALRPLVENYRPARRAAENLDDLPYPAEQVIPVGAVHNRLALEIARGCSRGCRFCHAGMVYRPVRERSPENLERIFNECLDKTGFEETSFLALSAGDYTALKTLFSRVKKRCSEEQVALALPSLRVGSADDDIMAAMAALRRTGLTLAPEAGSQRLRDVINKGIDEEAIIRHAQKALEHGWRSVKLYFMIGLPTETDEDITAIAELCKKIRDAGGPGAPRLAVTASLSPFVPKPFTPFQWEAQIERDELERRISLAREAFAPLKGVKLRWHNPEVSFLEGVLARGDRRLADAVELAYRKGAVFCAWVESFQLSPWIEAFSELGLDPRRYTGARDPEAPLPWDHFDAGVDREFLLRERAKAYAGAKSPDCRDGVCLNCGACDKGGRKALLAAKTGESHKIRLVFPKSDQTPVEPRRDAAGKLLVGSEKPERPRLNPKLATKAAYYKIWRVKTGAAAFLSQLEEQDAIARALRKARLPVAFSQGYHPMPALSFGRALPVGVESLAEWFAAAFYEPVSAFEIRERLNRCFEPAWEVTLAERTDKRGAAEQSELENFRLYCPNENILNLAKTAFAAFAENPVPIEKNTKKGRRVIDADGVLKNWRPEKDAIAITLDWRKKYISPLALTRSVLAALGERELARLKLVKTAQIFAHGRIYGEKN